MAKGDTIEQIFVSKLFDLLKEADEKKFEPEGFVAGVSLLLENYKTDVLEEHRTGEQILAKI